MVKVTWHGSYYPKNRPLIGYGLHVQDAFTKLSPADRHAATFASHYTVEKITNK